MRPVRLPAGRDPRGKPVVDATEIGVLVMAAVGPHLYPSEVTALPPFATRVPWTDAVVPSEPVAPVTGNVVTDGNPIAMMLDPPVATDVEPAPVLQGSVVKLMVEPVAVCAELVAFAE